MVRVENLAPGINPSVTIINPGPFWALARIATQTASLYEFQALEIFFAPASLDFNYCLKSLQGKRVALGVGRYCHSPAIGMPIALVGPSLTYEIKTVVCERGDEFSCGERTKASIIDGHVSRR